MEVDNYLHLRLAQVAVVVLDGVGVYRPIESGTGTFDTFLEHCVVCWVHDGGRYVGTDQKYQWYGHDLIVWG